MTCSGWDALTGRPVQIEFDSRITAIQETEDAPAGLWLAPGFVDIQINGYLGIDFNNPKATVDDVLRAVEALYLTGTTRCLPTVITGGPEDMVDCLKVLREAQKHSTAIAGFHVEGPHISPEEGPRGAHPLRWVRPPDLAEYHRWQQVTEGNVLLVTISPHWDEAPAYIAALVKDAVTVSIGHTHATSDQIQAAVDAGATMSTHLGNGAHAIMRRHPNYLFDQMAEDRLTASFIVDGIHLGKAFLTTALRAKGLDRSVLVTDAAAPAGCQPGRYFLGEQAVDLTPDDKVQLVGTQRLAGSALKMHKGVANLIRIAGLELNDAIRLATTQPAKCVRLSGRQRGLVPGEWADLVAFRMAAGEITIESVWLAGEQVV